MQQSHAGHRTLYSYFLKSSVCASALLAASCAPVVTSFDPTSGPIGTEVTVEGRRLASGTPPQSDADINGRDQSVSSASSASVQFTVIDGTTTGPVRITTSRGSDATAQNFVVVREPEDSSGGFTFEGDDGLQGERVSTSETGQKVIIGAVEPRWLNPGETFADVSAQMLNYNSQMSDFWEENSFGDVNFTGEMLGDGIIELEKSYQYYYHGARPRKLLSRALPATTTLTEVKTLTIENDGQDIEVELPAGNYTPTNFQDAIQDALDDAETDEAPPTFSVGLTGSQLSLNTTVPADRESKIELSGDALPWLGFGADSLFNLGEDGPIIMLFGDPLPKEDITFPADASITIATQGSDTTTANFTEGETLDLSEIVSRIAGAYPGNLTQQPFLIEAVDDPLDGDQAFLKIATNVDPGDDDGFMITVDGPARDIIGLSSSGSATTGLIERYEPEISRGYNAILDGFTIYARSLPSGTSMESIFGDARMFVGAIIDPTDNYRAFAGAWEFNILGDVFDVSFFTDSWKGSWQVYAHETGHALLMPDLYRRNSSVLGNPPGNWDIMDCSFCDAHSTSFLKTFRFLNPEDRPPSWISTSSVLRITPPSGSLSRTDQFILTPVESPWTSSSTNPFAASHPGIPVVHSVEFVPTDEADMYILENRQRGIYNADHLGDQVDFSQTLPDDGVIFYQARRWQPEAGAALMPVNLLTPMNNALNFVGESFRQTITLLNGIDLRVVEVLANPNSAPGGSSESYLVESIWGEGSFKDIAITPWPAPPYETVDMWIDNRAENDWDVYTYAADEDGLEPIQNGDNVKVGEVNRVYARIRNTGDVPIPDDIELIFKIAVPLRVGEADESAIETEIGRATITGGLGGKFDPDAEKTAFIEWTPRDTNQEHVCIKVYVTPVPDELNATANNSAQENLTQWFSETGSPFKPVSFEIITENPFPDRTAQIRLNAPNVPKGWTVEVEDVEFVLNPGEVYRQGVTITPDLSRLMPQIRALGYAEPYQATIEALTPFGDNWQVYGGITAIVHPSNEDSSITMIPTPGAPGGPVGAVTGVVTSSGPMSPPLAGRAVNVRFRTDAGVEIWERVRSGPSGRFDAPVPPALRDRPFRAKAFHGGGRGISPIESSEISVDPSSPFDPTDPLGGGGVVRQ